MYYKFSCLTNIRFKQYNYAKRKSDQVVRISPKESYLLRVLDFEAEPLL